MTVLVRKRRPNGSSGSVSSLTMTDAGGVEKMASELERKQRVATWDGAMRASDASAETVAPYPSYCRQGTSL